MTFVPVQRAITIPKNVEEMSVVHLLNAGPLPGKEFQAKISTLLAKDKWFEECFKMCQTDIK